MQITLSDLEVAALNFNRKGAEVTEDCLHRIILPLVTDASEKRLQELANAYRQLTPTDQLSLTQTAKDLLGKPKPAV